MSEALRKAAEQALEFLKYVNEADNDRDFLGSNECDMLTEAKDALRAALAEPEQSEPVAYGFPDTQLGRNRMMMVRLDKGQDGCTVPLYTAAPPRLGAYPLPDDLYDSKDWRDADYAGRVEWLHTMYEGKKAELDAYLMGREPDERDAVLRQALEALESQKAYIEANEPGLVTDVPAIAAIREVLT